MVRLNGRQRRGNGGFTLIEMILVILLILVIVNAATPLLRNTFRRARLESACNDLCQFMAYLRSRSVVEGVRHRLTIDDDNNVYWGEAQRPGEEGSGQFEPVADRLSGRHRFDARITLDTEVETLVFHPDGRIDEAVLTLRDGPDKAFRISVHGSAIRCEDAWKGTP